MSFKHMNRKTRKETKWYTTENYNTGYIYQVLVNTELIQSSIIGNLKFPTCEKIKAHIFMYPWVKRKKKKTQAKLENIFEFSDNGIKTREDLGDATKPVFREKVISLNE